MALLSPECSNNQKSGTMKEKRASYAQFVLMTREGRIMSNEVHSDQQTTDRHDPQRQFLQVTAPHHPLQGQVFPVLRALTKRGEDYVIIQLPSGTTQQLPRRWTDQCPALPAPPVLPLWSVTSLRELLGILKQLQARPCEEEVPNGSAPTPVDHVLSRDPARTGRAARRPAASTSARTTYRRRS